MVSSKTEETRTMKYSLTESSNEDDTEKCTPFDCMCAHYDNTHDNYLYSHTMNPANQYFFWVQEWKTQHQQIHEDCKKLGMDVPHDEYVKGYLDAISPEYPNLNSMVEEGHNFAMEWISDELKQMGLE